MEVDVSICITTFNRRHLLPYALVSALNQTYHSFEVIVVDDGSTDGTREYVESLLGSDSKLRYIRHENNQGLPSARNSAISIAWGNYFTFLDDDDEWDPDFLKKFMEIAAQFDSSWCFCCGTKYFKKGKIISITYDMEGPLEKYIKLGYTPPVAAQFYPIAMLNQVGGYDPRIKSGVDHDLWLKLAYKGKNIKCLKQALAFPNTNVELSRMTTDFSKRSSGIMASLELWREDMISNMGESFYHKFVDDYKDHLVAGPMKLALRRRNIVAVIRLFASIRSKRKFIRFVFRSINRNFFWKRHRVIVDKGLFGA